MNNTEKFFYTVALGVISSFIFSMTFKFSVPVSIGLFGFSWIIVEFVGCHMDAVNLEGQKKDQIDVFKQDNVLKQYPDVELLIRSDPNLYLGRSDLTTYEMDKNRDLIRKVAREYKSKL